MGVKRVIFSRRLPRRRGSSTVRLTYPQPPYAPAARTWPALRPHQAGYIHGLEAAGAARAGDQRLLVLFIGSTIGNFNSRDALEFLKSVRRCLQPGDALLLGADLVKPEPQLLAAYDDPIGVTAAFNLNLLARINHELGGNFDLRNFAHLARYNRTEQSVEMHLLSRCRQTVTIPAADATVTFEPGETIWTESSHKFTLDEIDVIASAAGFSLQAQWIDREWPFAETLMIVQSSK
jgi:L-histidine Nalpha-methyltransferase